MQVQIEIFLTRIVAGDVLYKKCEADISMFVQDPDDIVPEYYRCLLGHLARRPAPVIDERCIMHQTSNHWDTMKHALILTYLFYSEDFSDLKYHDWIQIPFRDVQCLFARLSEPEVARSELGIFAHALRHLAFLVQTDTDGRYRKMLSPANFKLLSTVPMGLAGRIG